MKGVLDYWKLRNKEKLKEAWKVAFFCVVWLVWRQRNIISFENGALSI